MTRQAARRSFLLAGGQPVLRPPGAVMEERFLDLCDGCGKCIAACVSKTGVLKPDRGGGPVLDFPRSHCTFCGACAAACPTGALRAASANALPWRMRIEPEDCLEFSGVACRACESACGERAIRFRPLPDFRGEALIDAAACTGCGECIGACPLDAITIDMTMNEGERAA